MSILRYTASLDNTITNAFEENLTTRGTGSNMGSSDILETFSIYGQATSSSAEQARILVEFPISQIVAEILAKKAQEKKIIKVFFDRGIYKYHGRVKTFAETLRKNGMEF